MFLYKIFDPNIPLPANNTLNPTNFVVQLPWIENFNIQYPTSFIRHNGPDNNYQDLRLMTLCRYNIIANSTFSWWGAWLNNYHQKIVVAPIRWFANEDDSINSKDIIPEKWIRL